MARFAEGIYGMHAFEKRSRATAMKDLGLARERYRDLLAIRKGREAMAKGKTRVSRSSGNTFHDVGFPPAQAEHLRVRADLMISIEKVLKARKLKQAQAAELMGVSQPRVSDLLRGKIELFSSDALIDMLARLGLHVRLVASPAGPRRAMRRPARRTEVGSPAKAGGRGVPRRQDAFSSEASTALGTSMSTNHSEG